MTNESFKLLSEEEKNTKFRAILNTRTDGALSGEEMRSLLLCVSPKRQYIIKVCHDKDVFRNVLQLADGYTGRTVLGQAFVSHEGNRGELFCTTRPAAVILRKCADEVSPCQLHIFVPPERLQKGCKKQ